VHGQASDVRTLRNSDLHQVGLKPDVNLFPFQLEDVDRFRDMKSILIGNEMGTGKTYEAVARDLLIRAEHPVPKPMTLVIAPLSVLPTWSIHFKTMTDLKVRMIDRKNRHDLLADRKADVYIVHWDVLRLMPELVRTKWHHIIADECHKMKNRKAKQSKAIRKFTGNFKTAMSGTPMVNRPDELWSVLDWLYRGKFGGYWPFFDKYCDFEIIYPQGFKKVTGCRAPKTLRASMDKFYVRRKKEDVLKDLPPKYYTTEWVEIGPKQRKAYNDMAKEMLAWIGENESNPLVAPVVIAKLIRLQQLALSYGDLVYNERDDEWNYYPTMPSAKIDRLLDILDSAGDKRVVVFSQFSKMIDLTQSVLEKKGYGCVKLTGQVRPEDRQSAIELFQKGEVQVFLATIAAGGVGITLTASSTAVFLDRDWSPANNLQAEDRLHRHGQKEPVQIIDIMASGTVDLGRKQKLELKWGWIKEILD
jgi:SNF2 family DNA or RNA helicase